uniref:Substrate-binding protein n=1 Tax=Natrinema zhouii TaxID=1710539 RepID=A0A7D6H8L4_9EURY
MPQKNAPSSQNNLPSRRTLLKASVGIGGVGLAGCLDQFGSETSKEVDSEYPSLGTYPVTGDIVKFGFNVPRSGAYSSEGGDELRAYKLAVKHLNEGGGWVDSFDDLSGDGLLGKEVDYAIGNTETNAETAADSARRLINQDDVIMISGGASSATAIAQQEVAQEKKVLYMCALTHSNDTTGKDCVRYGFREVFNAYMSGQALAPIVTDDYGSDLSFYQLYADYSWGQTQQASMQSAFEDEGWSQINSIPTPLGTKDYSSYLERARDSGADVIFLNHYGLDGANSLTDAVEMGLDEEAELIVPLYNRPMAQAAGGAIDGIYGTVAWDAQIESDLSNTFTETFQSEYNDRIPSGTAHLAYAQTLQYAAAAERAETFSPPHVIRELEGHEYDIGMGQETMRACDHQAQRPVPVVKGLPESEQQEGVFYEIEELVSSDQVSYDCDSGPAAQCSLGEYGDE